jgi:hypothetical protein
VSSRAPPRRCPVSGAFFLVQFSASENFIRMTEARGINPPTFPAHLMRSASSTNPLMDLALRPDVPRKPSRRLTRPAHPVRRAISLTPTLRKQTVARWVVGPENSIRPDSRSDGESAHDRIRCSRSSACLQHLSPFKSRRRKRQPVIPLLGQTHNSN